AGMIATDTVPDAAMGAKVISSSSFTQARGDKGVVEIIVLSRPDRRYYISETAADELRSSMRVQAGRLPVPKRLDNAGLKARAGELVKDIQQQVGQRIREDLAKPLGNLEVRLKSWEFPQDSAINALHQEFDWPSQNRDDDEARYAVDREAHFLRFAAQASAGFSGFDPKAGTVSLGVKGQASFALAEGKITFSHFLPNQGGRDFFIAYKDAHGQRVYHRFGAFRLRGAVELSCFSGITASGSGTVGVKWKPAPSGASALLLSPELDARGGKVQLKGNGFAGAQLGGALTGGLEWMAPALQHRPNAPWAPLVDVRMEGNVAYGAGRTGDFQVELTRGKLYLYCKGQLVFGRGAGGGFGTLVDFEKIAELVGVVYRALSGG
ncbi:LysM domain-containing protein, partial [Pseudomonas gingeri]|nr:LysM domain-containing protein [Pseudomonas gingeri]